MQARHQGILAAINEKRPYNILTAPTHERYQSNLSLLPHTFYMFQQGGNTKPWNFNYAPIPSNHLLLTGQADQFKNDMVFDIVLSQNKFGQAQSLKQYADNLNLPWINLEHTWPRPEWGKDQLDSIRAIRADFNVFISEQSCLAWGWSLDDPTVRILRHGIDTDVFKPDPSVKIDKRILTVANDYINRDHCLGYGLYQELTRNMPTLPVGDTPGLSKAAENLDILIQHYQGAGVFLNTSTHSPIPMSLIEAAACACPIVTNDTCACGDLIEDGVNGFISSDTKYLREKLSWCLSNPKEAAILGQKARETILNKFSLDKHITSWSKLLDEAYGSKHNQWS